METNEKEGLKSCKEWWKILIRHLRQLAKLLVFSKCWSVSCFVSLGLKVLKKTVSEALTESHTLALKIIPNQSTKRKEKKKEKRKRKKVNVCYVYISSPPGTCELYLKQLVPTSGYSVATWTV